MSEPVSTNENAGSATEAFAADAARNRRRWLVLISSFLPLLFMGIVAALVSLETSLTGNLEVIAAAIPMVTAAPDQTPSQSRSWAIKGVVTSEGQPVTDASVFAVVTDLIGNRFASETSTQTGNFEITISQGYSGKDHPQVDTVEVTATKDVWLGFQKKGTVVLRPEATGGTRWKIASVTPFGIAIVIFVISIALCLFPSSYQLVVQIKYYVSVLLGVGFTGAMIYFIATTSQELGGSSDKREVTSLGFAHVFFGAYLKDTEGDWLLSLTTPTLPTEQVGADMPLAEDRFGQPDKPQMSSPQVSRGFGAPLWVLLLSVIGAALYTIKLVVENSVDAAIHHKITHVPARIVQHQFYVLFAPIGAIFVYQLLILAGSASEPVIVSLAALASGVALNAVLDRAWRVTSGLVQETGTSRSSNDATQQS